MQAIPGGIKTMVILISNEMSDENTDQNTTQADFFSFRKILLETKIKSNPTSIELEGKRPLSITIILFTWQNCTL